jgi:hypothetical protein
MMRNCYLAFILLFVALSPSIKIETDGEQPVFIYYQSGANLFEISLPENTVQQVFSKLPNPVIFSPDNTAVAYRDGSEVWISDFGLLKFRSILNQPDELPAFDGLFWTPDSRFFIFSYADYVTQGDLQDEVFSYIYDRNLDKVSVWNWGDCASIVRNRVSKKLALKCSTIPSKAITDISSITLDWGGEQNDYTDDAYETLVHQIAFPGNFDWIKTDEGEQIIYINNDFPFEIYLVEGDKKPESMGLAANYTIVPNIIAVSPDRSKVAYMVECNYRAAQSCLQIRDVSTKAIVWNYEDTISVATAWRLKWSPDNRYVVMLGSNGTYDAIISAFDVVQGTAIQFSVGDAVGNLMVRSD